MYCVIIILYFTKCIPLLLYICFSQKLHVNVSIQKELLPPFQKKIWAKLDFSRLCENTPECFLE